MKKIIDYKIVKDNYQSVQDSVNYLIGQGYQPLGNLTYGGSYDNVVQVMVMYDDTEINKQSDKCVKCDE